MPYTIKEEKKYDHPVKDVQQASMAAIEHLGGKMLEQDEARGSLSAQLNKTILGKTVGERTQFNINTQALSDAESRLAIEAFPLDAIGRKLMFGARKGVTRKVLDWFYEGLENHLSS